MGRVKVVVSDYIEPNLDWEEEECRRLGVDFAYYQLKTAPPKEILEVAVDADILIVNMAKITAEVVHGLEHCQLIIRHGVGFDNVDIDAATEQGIVVAYIPDYCVSEVAEQAITLMMACQRKLVQQISILRKSSSLSRWNFDEINPIYRIRDKTVGIVGIGRIGSTVYRMLKGFNVNFLVCDPYISERRREELGVQTIPLDDVLIGADVVTLHVPMTWETYHMIDAPQFKRMKHTAILVNTSRGSVINLAALDRALRNGEIAMAGIDVYEVEPPAPDFPLLDNKHAILTPHLSWLSEEAGQSIRVKIMDDIKRFLNHQGPRHVANNEIHMRFASDILPGNNP